MDWSSTPSTSTHTTLWDLKRHNLVDRLSILPDELLIYILSLLPTKDAAATSVLSTKMRRVFALITNLDFDVSTICLCKERSCAIEKFSTFITFVTTVLQGHQSECLNRFRLKVSSVAFPSGYYGLNGCFSLGGCTRDCLPDLKSSQLSSWISFPLTLCGLRELDLCIVVREPGDAQLPAAIFICQTLEVLKLRVNIGIHQVLAMPSYSLPSLKVFYFSVSFISDDGFLPRLLASCPLLEDFEYEPFTEHVDRLIIQSSSLRRLCLRMHKVDEFELDINDFVYIDAPNLEEFEYNDNLAQHYSISINSHIVKAKLYIWELLPLKPEPLFHLLLNLIKPVSYVQHLDLNGRMFHVFNDVDLNVHQDQLPMFPNMKHLSLGGDFRRVFWDKILLPFLYCSPLLETLTFIEGIIEDSEEGCLYVEERMLEQKFFTTDHPIPSCCRYYLKTIVIHRYMGDDRENDFIRFLLRHALVLENLIIHRLSASNTLVRDKASVESTMISLPKASMSCSIQVL